jgi:hypothetical protein
MSWSGHSLRREAGNMHFGSATYILPALFFSSRFSLRTALSW